MLLGLIEQTLRLAASAGILLVGVGLDPSRPMRRKRGQMPPDLVSYAPRLLQLLQMAPYSPIHQHG
jgi:hypothetical protein